MSLLGGILAQVNSNVDVQNMAAKVGISPEQRIRAALAIATELRDRSAVRDDDDG